MRFSSKKYLKFAATIGIAAVLTTSTSLLYAQNSGTSTATGSSGVVSIEPTDAVEPTDVENLKATPGDSEVQLTWNSATDNVGVTGYRIYRGTTSVKTSEDRYDLPAIPVGNVKSYTVKNLTNGQTYYFSLTAVDAAGNESPNYATEASATPQSGLRLASLEDDGKPPQVKEVKAEDIITVQVVFSEPVRLPEEHPVSAFQIEKVSDKSRLEVQKAEIDARDETGQTVLLTTAPQEENAEYVVTAGIEIQDYFSNPVVSGTSDTGSFKGSAKQKETPATPPTEPSGPAATPITPGDKDPPKVTAGSADFSNRITISFSEKVVLPENPKTKFVVTKKGTKDQLPVVNVSLSVDGKTVYLTTETQEPVEYEVKVSEVKDMGGNAVSARANSVTVTGKGSSMKDLVPPEDVTKLIARIKNAEKNIVELRWEASKNSAKDLADQLLYQSDDKDGKSYGNSTSLGTSTTAVEVRDLKGGNWYSFKVATKDGTGNESKGAATSIFLPQTGPGVVAAGLTSLIMGWFARRKKQ